MSLSPRSLNLIDKIREFLGPVGQLIPYGSQIAGTSTGESDIDLALIVTDGYDFADLSPEAVSDIIRRACGLLRQSKVQILNVFENAKVPMIRARYSDQNFDIVVNGSSGVICSWLIHDMLGDNRLAAKVIRTVKEWAKANDLIGADKGRLGSHALTVFSLHYLITAGVVGLPHLENDDLGRCRTAIWTPQELNQYASRGANRHGPRDNLWWLGRPRRRHSRYMPTFKQLVRGIMDRLHQGLNSRPEGRLIYSMTTRAGAPVSEVIVASTPLIYIEDPISRHNTASNLKAAPCEKLKAEVAKARAYLKQKGTVTRNITSSAAGWSRRE